MCDDRQGLVLHDGVSLNLSLVRYVGFSYPLCHTRNPSLANGYSDCGPVTEYNLTVAIAVHFKRWLECINALLFCVSTESSIVYIFMLYMLIHTAVECVVVLWNRIYNLCTLNVLKGEDRG